MLGFCRYEEFVARGTLLSSSFSSSVGSMEVYLVLTRAMNIALKQRTSSTIINDSFSNGTLEVFGRWIASKSTCDELFEI